MKWYRVSGLCACILFSLVGCEQPNPAVTIEPLESVENPSNLPPVVSSKQNEAVVSPQTNNNTTASSSPSPKPPQETIHPVTNKVGADTSASNLNQKPIIGAENLRKPELKKPLSETKIAFTTNKDNLFSLYTIHADGSNLARLTTGYTVLMPAWSPDGTKIAFVSNKDSDVFKKTSFSLLHKSPDEDLFNYELYIINADGTHLKRMTDHPKADEYPAWSPDGTRIAFVSSRNGIKHIFVMNADGSHIQQLTHDFLKTEAPSWSPDGSRLVFSGYAQSASSPALFIMNVDGSKLTKIPHFSQEFASDGFLPDWSPDGSRIVFQSNRDAGQYDSDIYVINLLDGSLKRLANNPTHDNWPRWSPDGNKIVFVSDRKSSQEDIYIMDADGSHQTRLLENAGLDFYPAWSRE